MLKCTRVIFMAHNFFKKDIEPQCKYCEFGTPSGRESVLCKKVGGIMQPFSKCRKFKYDPLKREPRIKSLSTDFSKEDFSI